MAANHDLLVVAAEKVEQAGLVEANKISRTVDATWRERIIQKAGLGKIREVEVTARDAIAANEKFAGVVGRHGPKLTVGNV